MLTPEKILECCDRLEKALRKYQGVIEQLLFSYPREEGVAQKLEAAFTEVRETYIALEPLLVTTKRRIKKEGRETLEPWQEVPTFRGIKTIRDYEALNFFCIRMPLFKNDPVHLEFQNYFECLDSVRREAERQIQLPMRPEATPIPPGSKCNTKTGCVSASDTQTSTAKKPKVSGKYPFKEPSPGEMQAYKLSLFYPEKTQQEIAGTMRNETGTLWDQSRVSRTVKKVKAYIEAGNVLPDLTQPRGRGSYPWPMTSWTMYSPVVVRKIQPNVMTDLSM